MKAWFPLFPLVLSLVSSLAVGSPLSAQNLFFDTVDVAVVNLEVTVSNKDGTPVTGLGLDDFEVLEDGKVVEVSNFFAVAPGGGGSTSDAGEMPSMAETSLSDTSTPLPLRRTENLNLVVVLDYLNLKPQSRNQHLDGLRNWLDGKLEPGDQVMLVSLDRSGVRVVQPFTDDPESLLAAVETAEGQQTASGRYEAERRMLLHQLQNASLKSKSEGGIGQGLPNLRDFEAAMAVAEDLARQVETTAEVWTQQITASLEILGRFTDSLAGMPGRKAVVYVTDGLPQHTGRALGQGYLNKFEDWVFTQDAEDVRDEIVRMRGLMNRPDLSVERLLEETISRAAANRVSFYPVARTTGGSAGHVSAEHAGAGTGSGIGPRSSDVVAIERMERESSMILLAGGTGGTAFIGTPSMGDLIGKLEQDFRYFYSVGYHAPRAADNELHEIEVRVRNRRDLVVRHPEQIRRKSTLEELADITLSSLRWNVESNPLDVTLEAGEVTPGEKRGIVKMPLLVKIPFEKILLLPEEDSHGGKLTLMIAVEDPESGYRSDIQRVDLPIHVPNDQLVSVLGQMAGTQIELELREGHSRIAVGVHDHLAQMDSAVRIELDVEKPG